MTVREARCQCGQLRAVVSGDPVRVSVCHCLECQRRSASAFATQARFPAEQVEVTGESREWSRRGDDGAGAVFSFCPNCGSTVHYRLIDYPAFITVPVGAFADPAFPAPKVSVYEERKHGWVLIPGDVEHHA